jgi:two-component system, LytTR family, sensor kinase
MAYNRFMHFWKHSRIAYHVKILVASMILTALFLLIMAHKIENSVYFSTFPLVFIQMEIFMWLGNLFFPERKMEEKATGNIVRNTILRLLLFYVVVMLIAAAIFFMALLIRSLIAHQSLWKLLSDFMKYDWQAYLIGLASGFLFGIIVFLYFQWREALKREQKLREEKLVFRYETLKNQVNPHFLFNSLNTLASLVEVKPSEAGNFISKLAAIYRYVLVNKELDLVPLNDELAFAMNYFDLQKIRDGEKIKLETEIPDPGKYKVLPLSLQILLENVFKHNIASLENPLFISIKLANDGFLEVSNPLRLKNSLDTTPGTGLHNLGERTRLITGKDIRIVETTAAYTVRIPLIWSESENSDSRR